MTKARAVVTHNLPRTGYHLIRNEAKEGRIVVKHVETEGHHADILTAPTSLDYFGEA